MLNRICKQCGKEFQALVAQVNIGRALFCSRSCKAKTKRNAPSWNTRRTNEEIIAAYKETGNIWKAAKRLGLCGQSVWERLKKLDHSLTMKPWTDDERDELKALLPQCDLAEIGRRLGRSYSAIASQVSVLGLANKFRRGKRKSPKVRTIEVEKIETAIVDLKNDVLPVTPYARSIGVEVESLVQAIQKQDMEFWREYSKVHGIEESLCPQCGLEFYKLSHRQKCCSRKCSSDYRVDNQYFGGNRRNTVGLADGICQVCGEAKDRLSSHHVLGKENDPDNEHLIAVCSSCHQIVGLLAAKEFVDKPEGWETLIQLVMARRMRQKNTEYAGIYACVEVEHLFADEVTVQ